MAQAAERPSAVSLSKTTARCAARSKAMKDVITAGAARMHDDAVAVRDLRGGQDLPIHTHRMPAGTGDFLLRPRQRRRDRALARAELAYRDSAPCPGKVARTPPTPAMSTGKSHGTAGNLALER